MHEDRKLNSGKYEQGDFNPRTVGLHFRRVLTYRWVSQTDFNMIKLTTMTQKFQMLCSPE